MSTPISLHCEKPPHDSRASRAPTRNDDQPADVPNAGWDAPDLARICGKHPQPPTGFAGAKPNSVSKNLLSRENSRGTLKFRFRDCGKGFRIQATRRLNLIAESRKRRTRTRIAKNCFPPTFPSQFRQHAGQILSQLPPLIGRERTDARFDFLNSTHGTKLPRAEVSASADCAATILLMLESE